MYFLLFQTRPREIQKLRNEPIFSFRLLRVRQRRLIGCQITPMRPSRPQADLSSQALLFGGRPGSGRRSGKPQHRRCLTDWGASGFGQTSGCGRRNRNWRTKGWIHRLPMMSVRTRRARRSAPIELTEASPSAGRRGVFQHSGNSKLSAG